ncbi:MAG: hypothetical protein J0M18_08325 [Ignavibacteria bacterium]|nr:hypothetical protein [Ignavibacteria bacterium]
MADKNSYKIAIKRFKDLQERTFNYYFDLFVYNELSSDVGRIENIEITKFEIFLHTLRNEHEGHLKLKEEYFRKHSNPLEIPKLDKLFEGYKEWESKIKHDIDSLYFSFIGTMDLKESEFLEIFGEDNSKTRKCHYCGIGEDIIKELIRDNRIHTKRLWQRGRSMEIDRKDPFQTYDKNNIVLCCYWCNNAKTDEFTEEEFKLIAKGIKEVWNDRIQKYNDKNPENKLEIIK